MKSENSSLNEQIERLFSLNVHLGHRKNRLHPKAKKYVYKMINGVTIIDLAKTVKDFESAKQFLTQAGKENQTVILVATKKIINQFATKLASSNNLHFITNKWLPGLLTNFETIIKNVKKLNKLEKEKTDGAWDKFVKHERVKLEKEIIKLKKLYGGIAKLEKKPDFMILIDIRKEKNALKEAIENNLKTVAILDTNCNPNLVDYPIVANDDSSPSLEYLLTELIKSYTNSKTKA